MRGRPFGLLCASDIDGDLLVDVQDLARLILAWNTTEPSADVDDSGTVGVGDLARLLLRWGVCPGHCHFQTDQAASDCARITLFRVSTLVCPPGQEVGYVCNAPLFPASLSTCGELCQAPSATPRPTSAPTVVSASADECTPRKCSITHNLFGFAPLSCCQPFPIERLSDCGGTVRSSGSGLVCYNCEAPTWSCSADNECVPDCGEIAVEAKECTTNDECLTKTVAPTVPYCGAQGGAYVACVENKCQAMCPNDFCANHSSVTCARGTAPVPSEGFCAQSFTPTYCRNRCGCVDDGSRECDDASECQRRTLEFPYSFQSLCDSRETCSPEGQCQTECNTEDSACASLECDVDLYPVPLNGQCTCRPLVWARTCNHLGIYRHGDRHDFCSLETQTAGARCTVAGAYCALSDGAWMVCVDRAVQPSLEPPAGCPLP